jgi:hypothetical protein
MICRNIVVNTADMSFTDELFALEACTDYNTICSLSRIYRCHQQRDLERHQVFGASHSYICCTVWGTGRNLVALLLVVSESSLTVIVVTSSVKEDERGGQGHTSESLLRQSAT